MSRTTADGCVSRWRRSRPASSFAQEKEDPVPVDRSANLRRRRIRARARGDSLACGWLRLCHARAVERGSRAGRDLVSHDPATGEKRVLVSAAELDSAQGIVAACRSRIMRSRTTDRGCSFSPTASASGGPTRVATTGCSTGPPASCGNWAETLLPSSLMHAKFAPNGSQVAYVRENNIYVEDLVDGRDHQADELAVRR